MEMFASAVMRSTEAADLMAWPLDERAPLMVVSSVVNVNNN